MAVGSISRRRIAYGTSGKGQSCCRIRRSSRPAYAGLSYAPRAVLALRPRNRASSVVGRRARSSSTAGADRVPARVPSSRDCASEALNGDQATRLDALQRWTNRTSAGAGGASRSRLGKQPSAAPSSRRADLVPAGAPRTVLGSSACRHGQCPASLPKCTVLAAPDAGPAAAAPALRCARDPAEGSAGACRRRALSAATERRARLDSISLGDAASYGLHGRLDTVLDVELGEDPGDVVGDGVRAQREVSRDLVVALAACESLEDLELAVGQGSADGDRGNGAGLDGDVELANALQELPRDF